VRREARLLRELTRGTGGRVLSLLKLACGDLERHLVERDAPLPDQADSSILDGADARTTVMADYLAHAPVPIGKPNVKRLDREDPALPLRVYPLDVLAQASVGCKERPDVLQ